MSQSVFFVKKYFKLQYPAHTAVINRLFHLFQLPPSLRPCSSASTICLKIYDENVQQSQNDIIPSTGISHYCTSSPLPTPTHPPCSAAADSDSHCLQSRLQHLQIFPPFLIALVSNQTISPLRSSFGEKNIAVFLHFKSSFLTTGNFYQIMQVIFCVAKLRQTVCDPLTEIGNLVAGLVWFHQH